MFLSLLMLVRSVLSFPASDLRMRSAFFGVLKLGLWGGLSFNARLLLEIKLGCPIEAFWGEMIEGWLEFDAAGIKICQIQAGAKGSRKFLEYKVFFADISFVFINYCCFFTIFCTVLSFFKCFLGIFEIWSLVGIHYV